jgi:hypothetical protein
MLVYAAGDIVSSYLAAKPKWYWPFVRWGWERYEIQQVLWALRQYKPRRQQQQQGGGYENQAAAAAAAGGGGGDGPLFVDVGANVGAFTFHAAAAGARVAAF